jgi:stearoyl-CoA desaturase (delta-9 desaturase)
MYSLLDFLDKGLLNLSGWQITLITLIAVQITLSGVSLYLHRDQTHRGIKLHPAIAHFYRFWLWFTTGMLTKDWVAIHRKHHAFCETEDDPHSPQVHGIKKVLFDGVGLYTQERKNQETLDKYGQGTPNDWLERNVYTRFHYAGILLLAAVNVTLFGIIGLAVFAIQVAWIPFFAAGIINGLGHFSGYRNYRTDDSSRNLTRFAFFIYGEELHNNHHAFPSSCQFAHKKGEHDIGWYTIRALNKVGLCEIKKTVPQLCIDNDQQDINHETIKALVTHKFNVLQKYINDVIKPQLYQEYAGTSKVMRKKLKKYTRLLSLEKRYLQRKSQELQAQFSGSETLQILLSYKQELQTIWNKRGQSVEEKIEALKIWCQKAEASGIQMLQDFAQSVQKYRLQLQPA